MTKNFIKQNYTADRIIVSVAGPIPNELVVDKTIQYLGDIEPQKSNLNRTNPDLVNSQIIKEDYRDINQVHICIARKTFGVKDERRSVLSILNTLIGGMTSSRLFQLIREEQALAYNTSSFINNYYDASVFGVYLSTSLSNREKVIELIRKEFQSIREDGIKEDELEIARNYLKGGISMSMENTSSKSTHLAVSEFYYGEVKSLEEIFASIDKVTKKEVVNLADELLKWDDYSIYQIVPREGGKNGN